MGNVTFKEGLFVSQGEKQPDLQAALSLINDQSK